MKMKKGESGFNTLNKVLIALIIVGLLTKIYILYVSRAVFTNFTAMFFGPFILMFALPIIFIYGAVKQYKFYAIVMSIWVFRDFLNSWSNNIIEPLMLGTANEYLLFNVGVTILLLAMAIISMILYIKSFKSVKEALS